MSSRINKANKPTRESISRLFVISLNVFLMTEIKIYTALIQIWNLL